MTRGAHNLIRLAGTLSSFPRLTQKRSRPRANMDSLSVDHVAEALLLAHHWRRAVRRRRLARLRRAVSSADSSPASGLDGMVRRRTNSTKRSSGVARACAGAAGARFLCTPLFA